jgi:cytochrome c oxidase cbb3-type subunit 4
MYKNVLQSIDNIALWPVISFIIFFLFFVCLVWWVITIDKRIIKNLKNLPMDQTEDSINDKTEDHQ